MSERETVSCQPPSVGKKALLGPGPRRSLGGTVCCLSESGVYIVIQRQKEPGRAPGTPQLPGGWFLRCGQGRGGGMGGEQRLCWGRTKGEDKDYFKPVLITAPNRDWGWERSCHREAGEGGGRESGGEGPDSPPSPGPQPSPAVSLGPC